MSRVARALEEAQWRRCSRLARSSLLEQLCSLFSLFSVPPHGFFSREVISRSLPRCTPENHSKWVSRAYVDFLTYLKEQRVSDVKKTVPPISNNLSYIYFFPVNLESYGAGNYHMLSRRQILSPNLCSLAWKGVFVHRIWKGRWKM